MGNLTTLATARKVPKAITATRADDGALLVRIEAAPVTVVDELVKLADTGIEDRAWRALVKSGELAARKIGREWWSTRSALCRLILDAPTAAKSNPTHEKPDDAYAALIAKGGRR